VFLLRSSLRNGFARSKLVSAPGMSMRRTGEHPFDSHVDTPGNFRTELMLRTKDRRISGNTVGVRVGRAAGLVVASSILSRIATRVSL
jgi:hypothetical protein